VAAASGALGFGTGTLFWSQAVVAEVYTLNALLVALSVLVLLVWRQRREDKYLLLAAFLTGLSMTNHMTSALLLPAGFLCVLLVEGRKKILEWRLWLKGAGLIVVGLLPYIYLPLRALADPPINVGNPSNLGGFLELISGAQFKGDMFVFGPWEVAGRLHAYLVYLLGQFHWVFLMVTLTGALYLLVRDRAVFWLLSSLYFGWLFYALEYDIGDIETYFIPTYLILAIFGAVGLGALFKEAQAFTRGCSPGVRRLILGAFTALALLIPLLGLEKTYHTVDHSQDYEGQRIIDLVARDTEPGSTIFQLRSPLYYAQVVQGRREDLRLISFFEPQNEQEPQSDEEKVNRLTAAAREGSLYMLFPGDELLSQAELAGYRVVPVEKGTLYRVVP
jgi:4-amino-4-deoxy-L-arabinose transferase-like glycosyltransferase